MTLEDGGKHALGQQRLRSQIDKALGLPERTVERGFNFATQATARVVSAWRGRSM